MIDSVHETPPGLTHSRQVTDDLDQMMQIIPPHLSQPLEQHPDRLELVEVVMDLGRLPEARFPAGAAYLAQIPVTKADLQYCIDRVGEFSGDNRAGIEGTLHRISALRNRRGEIIGLTCRVGRAVFGTIGMIRDLVETNKSILMLGRPGVGKTTALREIARVLADDLHRRVVIIDSSNEIAGDGDVPHPAIGRARRMQVARPELQHQVMIEAVENHMPEVIVIDEIGTELEALAARTIAERGVQLVGTAHGNRIENLIKNPTLADLVGGIQAVTLGDDEARRRGSQKTVLERKSPPTFEIAVEMLERQSWVVHQQVSDTVDSLLRGRQPSIQTRTAQPSGEVLVTYEDPAPPEVNTRPGPRSWRGAGEPLSLSPIAPREKSFAQMLEEYTPPWEAPALPGLNGEDTPLHIYPYAIGRHQIEQVIQTLKLPVVITREIDGADMALALRSQMKSYTKLRQMAKARQVPIYTIKSASLSQIARALRRMLNLEEPETPAVTDLDLYMTGESDDEIEALEEARLAVEQVVIPQGQPVELLPRPAGIRKIQHELVEHYRLESRSFGEEPNRRLRIYPA